MTHCIIIQKQCEKLTSNEDIVPIIHSVIVVLFVEGQLY